MSCVGVFRGVVGASLLTLAAALVGCGGEPPPAPATASAAPDLRVGPRSAFTPSAKHVKSRKGARAGAGPGRAGP